MSASRPYQARKSSDSDSWEIVNSETDEIVDSGLDEDTAKSRAELSNDMFEEASKESESDHG